MYVLPFPYLFSNLKCDTTHMRRNPGVARGVIPMFREGVAICICLGGGWRYLLFRGGDAWFKGKSRIRRLFCQPKGGGVQTVDY